MIMLEFATGKRPFYDRPYDDSLISDILKGEKPQITGDIPEFYAQLMKKCWDPNPKNRPTTEEVYSCFEEYYMFHKFISEEEIKVIRSREAKHLEIIKLGWEYLLD